MSNTLTKLDLSIEDEEKKPATRRRIKVTNFVFTKAQVYYEIKFT